MQHRTLGRTGIQVSPFCLGAMMFGALGNPDHDDAIAMIHTALDAGVNFVDTADMYSQGESEKIVGKALQGRRDEVVVATKFHGPMGEDLNRRGNSRRWIMTAVEDSLRRLQTDHIDLYQTHRPDPTVDQEETLSALTDLVRSGKVGRSGPRPSPPPRSSRASGSPSAAVSSAIAPSSRRTRSSTGASSPRSSRWPSATAWAPWSGARWRRGCSPARIRRGEQTDLRRASRFANFADERRLDAVEQLVGLAAEAGLPMTHLAIAFAIAHPGVTSAIIGPRTREQLEDLLAAVDVRLDDDLLDRIDAIVPPGTDVGAADQSAYLTPALRQPGLRRRPLAERSAA